MQQKYVIRNYNDENWPLRGACCFAKPSSPKSGQTLPNALSNISVSNRCVPVTDIWIKRLAELEGGGSLLQLAPHGGQFS